MRFSNRFPGELDPNEWSRMLADAKRERLLLDLTETNPTRAGLWTPAASEHLVQIVRDSRGRYEPDPRGDMRARTAIAREFAPWGRRIDPQHIVVTASTSEAYSHLFRLLVNPGENILMPSPSYPLVPPIASLENIEIRNYPLEYDGKWRMDVDAIGQQVDPRTRAIVVVQPNNPTGSCVDAAERAALIDLATRNNLAIISDEVFIEFPWPGGEEPFHSFLGEERVLTFVMNGISKSCGLPQMKLAWIVVRGPEDLRTKAIAGLEWIADLFLSVSTPAQEALPGWLAARSEFQRLVRDRIGRNLEAIRRMIWGEPAISLLQAQGGWSAILRVPEVRTEEEWAVELLRRGVAVHPGHFYDLSGGAHLVVSLLSLPHDFARGMEILQELASGE